MTITIKSADGVTLAEVDSDSVLSGRIKAKFTPCPVCLQELVIGRDEGRWFMVGTYKCPTCSGLYELPSEAELADMRKQSERS